MSKLSFQRDENSPQIIATLICPLAVTESSHGAVPRWETLPEQYLLSPATQQVWRLTPSAGHFLVWKLTANWGVSMCHTEESRVGCSEIKVFLLKTRPLTPALDDFCLVYPLPDCSPSHRRAAHGSPAVSGLLSASCPRWRQLSASKPNTLPSCFKTGETKP